jgi:uncharacterized membrane protein
MTMWLLLAITILVVLCLCLTVLAAPIIVVILLRPALACVDGGSRKPAHIAAALVAWVADLVAAHTTWAWFIGGLHPGEKTISDTLERLANEPGENQLEFFQLSQAINRRSPTKAHIKVVL